MAPPGSSSKSAYVPPHMRNRPAQTEAAPPGPTSSTYTPPSPSGSRGYNSAPARSSSRTPWSSAGPPGPPAIGARGYQPSTNGSASPRKGPYVSAPAGSGGSYSSPSLYIFGDSFVGPFKLLAEDNVKVQTFKGSSAKGLNNPNSIKQVSRDLVPILNHLLAPPPYAYMPSTGRWALLIFGNVDLQINYLWQLANKPISSLSNPNSAYEADSGHEGEAQDDQDQTGSASVLATATETSAKGPALGPDDFVESVAGAYIAWLSREIIDGPIGGRLREAAEQKRSADPAAGPSRRRLPPSKVLIAAALPPLIEDELLPRIPEKYVERLEEDHEKAQRALDRAAEDAGSRTPWARTNGSPRSTEAKLGDGDLDVGLSTLTVSDDKSTNGEKHAGRDSGMSASTGATKTPITTLLEHDPPLCTLPVRVRMTNMFNERMSEFCGRHPDVLSFVDIGPAMSLGSESVSTHGEVDRGVWACPVDPTNVHPLWEPTLPLWLEELKTEGLSTDAWRINDDAEETFKAYEADKRKRTERGEAERGERVKLRDE
ncbi:hypothetical protein IAU60_006452 [Kwoniella sp. DSM 27419]